jgi:CRP-like cAMP-binding protein
MVALDTLAKLDFLDGFPPDYLKPLAAVADVVSVPAGEVLFREGEKSPRIYLIISGKVALDMWVTGNGETPIQTVGPGKLLGWTPILTQKPMTARAVTKEPCELLAINAMQVLEACNENPRFGMEFMRRTAIALSRRLNATRQQLLDAYEATMPVMSE